MLLCLERDRLTTTTTDLQSSMKFILGGIGYDTLDDGEDKN